MHFIHFISFQNDSKLKKKKLLENKTKKIITQFINHKSMNEFH